MLIKTKADYKKALKIVEALMKEDPEKDSIRGNRLRNLCSLIEKYELKIRFKKWDFESDDKEILDALNKLEKILLNKFGQPCRKMAVRCITCQVWTAFDNLKLMFY
jgi:hypothetical protein